MCQIFSASIPETAGFQPNTPIPGLPGWFVDRQNQTSFYKIVHNLHLTNPKQQLKVFAFSDYQSPLQDHAEIYNKKVEVFNEESDYFLIRTLEKRTSRPVYYENSGPFTFVAVFMTSTAPPMPPIIS